MRRGEIWSVSGGPDYSGKPRPAVILQDDRFELKTSVTLCPFTGNLLEAPIFRLRVEPSSENGLRQPSVLMADKITTVPRTKIGQRVGRLSDEDMLRLNRAIVVFLGIAS